MHVAVPSSDVTFSLLNSFCSVDQFHQPYRLLKFPWIAPKHWRYSELVVQYVTAGMFSDRVPVRALDIPEWEMRFSIPSRDILHRREESLVYDRTELVRILNKRLIRVTSAYPVTAATGIITCYYSAV